MPTRLLSVAIDGSTIMVVPAVVSTGVEDAGRPVALNADGLLDATVLPVQFVSAEGVQFTDDETPAGILDGNNKEYMLLVPPNPPSSLMLFQNGILLRGRGNDYTLSARTFTMVNAPASLSTLSAHYRH